MDRPTSLQGQTLVELAVVLPCFCLGIFMGLQLMYYCHNMISLQRMATVVANRISIENYKDAYKYTWFYSLYGNAMPPTIHYQSQVPASWKPFRGLSTVKERGRIVQVTVQSQLLPGLGFSRVLPRVTQDAAAEIFLEPPIPQENE